jgi:pyruvate/2-oxoglutarate dehydrogenase complex dihydrolipoamide acyltransferase (E2) component
VATPLNIPKLGTAMSEGTLVEWLVADGDQVDAGQPVYRLETDKVENEVEAPVGGRLKILAEAGGAYEVGAQVGEIE